MLVTKKCFILECCFIVFISCMFGCRINNSSASLKISTDEQIVNYIYENFDRYNERITEETGCEGRIIEEKNDDGQSNCCIEFDIDNSTKIKFGANESFKIVKELKTKSSINKKENDEIVICLYGLEDDDKIRVTLIGNGSISSEYKVNDIEHPISNRKEKEEGFDVAIKQNISTEEMEELISKARSIYSVFQEIAEEYNKSLE